MGKPFIVYQENEPHSRRSSDTSGSFDVYDQIGKLNAAETLLTSSPPPQDALQAAETYFHQVSKSPSLISDGHVSPPRTLFEMIVVDTEKPASSPVTQQGKSIGEAFQTNNSTWPAEEKRTTSPDAANIDLEALNEFSLDDLNTSAHEATFSPSVESISNRELLEIEQGNNSANLPRALGEGSVQLRGEPKSPSDWDAVFMSVKSRDSTSPDSFQTSRSAGISFTSSRGSLSEEAISERVAAWGNGVAKLVLKNSSLDTTPRTSNGSSADSLQFDQKIPGVSKQVRDTLSSFQLAFVVCDVTDPEYPILYASAGFFNMTGYSPEDVVGRNCRFLQGVDTDPTEVARIRTALKRGESYSGTILNYRKNGAPFWNLLTLSPISDDKGVVIKYMGMQAEVSSHSMMARRKKMAVDANCKDVPSLLSLSEETAQPSTPQSKRSERELDVPIFSLPSMSRVTAANDSNGRSQGSKRYSLTYGADPRSRSSDLRSTNDSNGRSQGSKRFSLTHGGHARNRSSELRSINDSNGRSQGSKRYSLTYGAHARSRSSDLRSVRPTGSSERFSTPSERKRSLAPQQRSAKTSSARPFYWILTAARILEEEIQQLRSSPRSSPNFAKEYSENDARHHERKGGAKNTNKISRAARGVFGLFRKLEMRVLKRKSRAPSNRVNAYESESDSEIDDFPEIDITKFSKFERQDLRCESMPHINLQRGGPVSNFPMQTDFRARSDRYFPSAISEGRSSALNRNEFRLDREQFCIIHE